MSEFRRAAVMGWPVAHSRSPALHGHWLERYGIAGSYGAIPVQPEDLEPALRALPADGVPDDAVREVQVAVAVVGSSARSGGDPPSTVATCRWRKTQASRRAPTVCPPGGRGRSQRVCSHEGRRRRAATSVQARRKLRRSSALAAAWLTPDPAARASPGGALRPPRRA